MHKNPFLCVTNLHRDLPCDTRTSLLPKFSARNDERISENHIATSRNGLGIGTLLAVAFTLLLWLSLTYGQTEHGYIQGQIIDKKQDKSLGAHLVTLSIHKVDTVETQKTTTDESGNYRFGDLPLDASVHYTVSIAYEGTDYTEEDLVLSTWAPNLTVNFEIGAFTDDRSNIQIKAHTFVIGPPPPDHAPDGALSVMEVLQVENQSDMPFQTQHDNQAVGLHLGIPAGYEAFQVHTQHELAINPKTQQIILKKPLPPGTSELGFAYILHLNRDQFDLSRFLNFGTALVHIFVPDGINLKPNAKQFSLTRREAIHNRVYTIYQNAPADSFAAGATADFRLKLFNPEAPQAKDLGQMALIAVAAALAGGFLVAAIFKLRRAGNQSVSPTEGEGQNQNAAAPDAGWLRKLSDADLEHVRVARLEFITYLDEMHEKQDISERVYNRLRREQTERLTEILVQCKARGLNE